MAAFADSTTNMFTEMNGTHDTTGGAARSALEKAAFFRESKYAMFIHWGLYSQAASCREGKPFYGISEWMMFCRQIPVRAYERLANEFNPVAFDAERRLEIARNAGMRYIVITANRHEGFALFRSSDPLNVVDATPFGRDPLCELTDAGDGSDPKWFATFRVGVPAFKRAGIHRITFRPVTGNDDDPLHNGGIDLHALTLRRYRGTEYVS